MSTIQNPTQEPQPTDDKPEALSREEVQTMINGALGTHGKRTEKLITDALAKALEPITKAQAPKLEEEAKGKDAQAREIAELRKRLDDTEKARQGEADARRRDAAQGRLRSLLEEKGIRKEALGVLVTALSADGSLRYDEEGKPLLAVKRSRAKGASAEEYVFDDLQSGVEDWIKTDVAAAFIKAPTVPVANGRSTGAPRQYTTPALNEEEQVHRVMDLLTNK
jgi:hypothetical protein